jgi:hypothetical protein
MLTQVSAITTNGVQQQTIAGGQFANPTIRPPWPGLVTPAAQTCPGTRGVNPFPCFSGVHVFHQDYKNPRIYTFNAGFEQEIAPHWAIFFDYTYSRGRDLTRFLNYGRAGLYGLYLGDVFFHTSFGKSDYHGFTSGIRKRFSNKFQFDAKYVWSRDKDDDSNERDPFSDRSIDPLNPGLDYSLSDRDIPHKFNLFAYFELPWKFEFTPRFQARSAQPASPIVPGATSPSGFALVNGKTSRNTLRKDNDYFSFDWRLARPFHLTERVELIPQIEMFNTFNNNNYVNSLWTAGNQLSLTAPNLFNFDGYLRQGIGDPRTVQLSVRLTF